MADGADAGGGAMFCDASDEEVLDVKSTWREGKTVRSCDMQTNKIEFADGESQTVAPVHAGVQTDPTTANAKKQREKSKALFKEEADDIAKFLGRVVPDVEAQLEMNLRSHAFDGFDDNEAGGSAEQDLAVKQTLMYKHAVASGNVQGMQCTGLSWNATGSIVCAAFGRVDIDGWDMCALTSKPALCCWNLFSRDFKTDKPQLVYETSSCITSICCHPTDPALVAAGTFNGEVMVWNTAKADDPLVAASRIDDYFHREPISSIEWVMVMGERQHQIASISGDGKVLFWSLRNKLKCPMQGFRLSPKKKGGEAARSAKGFGSMVGGVALSFSHDGLYSSSMVSSTEGGSIFRCFLKGSSGRGKKAVQSEGGDLSWSRGASEVLSRVPTKARHSVQRHVEKFARQEKVTEVGMDMLFSSKPDPRALFPNATGFAFAPHTGPVYALDCSPTNRHVFVSGGADGEVHVHSMLQAKPLRVLETSGSYIFDVKWSRVRPMVLAAAAASGHVYVYDLSADPCNPVATVEANRGVPVLCLAFNPKQRNMLASGDGSGVVTVWQLPWKLANLQPREELELAAMVEDDSRDDDDDA